ncbi:MAG: hypothetical protein D4R79_05090 [Comamonadaceae bacterium]|nr:MAG: hypothetical protein D4R79_05090 [Comamonadaceae bacterium]
MDATTGKLLMDRRQLLITINGLALSTLLPTSAPSAERLPPKIGVVAVGRMSELIFDRDDNHVPASMRSIAIDTDADSLHRATADRKILVTNGSSVPGNPEAAVLHAKRTLAEIVDALAGLDLAILVVGLGGAAGTTIAPVVARVLKSQNTLTLAVPTLPFAFEGDERQQLALSGFRQLEQHVDSVLPIFSTALEADARGKTSRTGLRATAPLTVIQLCRSLDAALTGKNIIEVDMEDLRHLTLTQQGMCAFGFGYGTGTGGAMTAARHAVTHPLLGPNRLQTASTVLISIECAPQRWMLKSVRGITEHVINQLPNGCRGIYSVTTTASLGNRFRVSILASGIDYSMTADSVSTTQAATT